MADLLEATTKTDEDLSEPVSRLADRAIMSVSDFLAKLSAYDASCSLTTRSKSFQFVDVEQVKRSKERLSLDNITETIAILKGEFIGALPDKRTFEFRTTEGLVIYGTIPREIGSADSVNQHLYRIYEVKLCARQIGSSKPRYIIQSLPWAEETLSRDV